MIDYSLRNNLESLVQFGLRVAEVAVGFQLAFLLFPLWH